jgi:hypothetical protein
MFYSSSTSPGNKFRTIIRRGVAMAVDSNVSATLSDTESGRMPMKKRGSVLTKLINMRFPSICPAIVDGKLHRATPKDNLLLSSLCR